MIYSHEIATLPIQCTITIDPVIMMHRIYGIAAYVGRYVVILSNKVLVLGLIDLTAVS